MSAYTTIEKFIRRLANKVNGGQAFQLFERMKLARKLRTTVRVMPQQLQRGWPTGTPTQSPRPENTLVYLLSSLLMPRAYARTIERRRAIFILPRYGFFRGTLR